VRCAHLSTVEHSGGPELRCAQRTLNVRSFPSGKYFDADRRPIENIKRFA
jgi:hypothetical protein